VPKAAILGYYGFRNLGDEAVLAGIHGMLSLDANGPRHDLIVLSADPEWTQKRHPGVTAISRYGLRSLRAQLKGIDTFILGGGSLLQDATSLRSIFWYFLAGMLAGSAARQTIWWGQGIGPLRHPVARKLTGILVRQATIVTVRDEASKALLTACAGPLTIDVCADPAFYLGHLCNEQPRDQTGIFYSLRSWKGKSLQFPIGDLSGAWHLPMHLPDDIQGTPGEFNWDASSGNPFPAVMRAIVGSQLAVSVRLHTLILAAAAARPCLAISYDPKVDALASQLGAPCMSFDSATPDRIASDVAALLASTDSPESQAMRRELASKMARLAMLPRQRLDGLYGR
jgi:polysaccharide pyruvyl transferase WcaK-like protein